MRPSSTQKAMSKRPAILLNCRICFSRSGARPGTLRFQKLSADPMLRVHGPHFA